MKELKVMSKSLTILAIILLMRGQGVSQVAAQQVSLLAAAELPVLENHAIVGGAATACYAADQESSGGGGAEVTTLPNIIKPHCPIPPIPHYVQYRAFIPADHLVTTVPCYITQQQASPAPPINMAPFNVPLGVVEVLGDASSFSTHFRIEEYTDLVISSTGPGVEPPVIPVPSVSYNFEYPSTRGNIVAADFNPTKLLRCFHEQSTGSASLANVGGTTSSTGAYQASVRFCCSATDPLFTDPVAPIQYQLTVSINTQTQMATITGSHTCFPSHEIVIGAQVVYQKNPAAVNFVQLSRCLLSGTLGLPQTQVNCTVKLDGVDKCQPN